jgi:acetyl esterase/lipase
MMKPITLIVLYLLAAIAMPAVAQTTQPATAPATKVHKKEQKKGFVIQYDLDYGGQGNPRQMLDLYLPENAKRPMRLIIWIHGGGWQSGHKNEGGAGETLFAPAGYAVASLNYRLTTKRKDDAVFPEPLEDVKAAVRWLRAHAGEYDIDAERVGVWGHSAGAHLAAMIALTEDDEYKNDIHPEQSSRVQAVAMLAGPVDLVALAKHNFPNGNSAGRIPTIQLVGGRPEEKPDVYAAASPTTHVTPDAPPFFIIQAEGDIVATKPETERFVQKLKDAGVEVTVHYLPGDNHSTFSIWKPSHVKEMVEFFNRHIKDEKKP